MRTAVGTEAPPILGRRPADGRPGHRRAAWQASRDRLASLGVLGPESADWIGFGLLLQGRDDEAVAIVEAEKGDRTRRVRPIVGLVVGDAAMVPSGLDAVVASSTLAGPVVLGLQIISRAGLALLEHRDEGAVAEVLEGVQMLRRSEDIEIWNLTVVGLIRLVGAERPDVATAVSELRVELMRIGAAGLLEAVDRALDAVRGTNRAVLDSAKDGQSDARPCRAGTGSPHLRMTAWHGEAYDRISAPHAAIGAPVLERLELRGDERVLDAGCGSGRLTEELLVRLPDGWAVALDASASMLAEAARRLAHFGPRVSFVQADLADPPLPIGGQVDAVMSTAAFHWVLDHEALFRGLAGALRPGGRLAFQCGGRGNAAALIEAARAEGHETAGSFTMAGPEETRARLAAAGFVDIDAWLEPVTITFETRDEMVDYIVTPYLRPATGLPEPELARVGVAIADRLGRLAIDYVRLNVTARSG